MDNNVQNQWFSIIENQRISQEARDALKHHVASMLELDRTIILNAEHLAKLVGLDYKILNQMLSSPKNYYREFSIPKRHGGTRLISAPYPSLLSVQHWIYNNILLREYEFDDCVTGFVVGRSVLDNASPHCGKRVVVQMDLKDFFPSIKLNRVVNVFKVLGYYNQMAYYLADLCCLNGELPQGAPTSPILSNIVAGRMDRRLKGLCHQFSITYTRYADDLTFSGEHIGKSFLKLVTRIINDEGFQINDEKTKVLRKNSRRIITGVSISSGHTTIPKVKKRRLRQELYYINKYGLKNHMRHEEISDIKYWMRLNGHLAFWNFVDRNPKIPVLLNPNINYPWLYELRNKILEGIRCFFKSFDNS